MDDQLLKVRRAKILLDRLERLSADSLWAHRASGLRGSIIRILNHQAMLDVEEGIIALEILLEQGFDLLTKAAKEIPDCEKLNK